MNWVGIVLWIITNAPELIALVRKLIDLIKSLPKDKAEAVKSELGEAIKSKDKNKVEEVLKKECSGVGCPASLKKD